MCSFYEDERGIEPTIMKLLVGVILVAVGLGVGLTMYNSLGDSVSSALKYDLTTSPSSASVSVDNSIEVSVEVNSLSEFDGSVNLQSFGTPENVEVIFRPESGDPDFGSTMRITVGEHTQVGTHTITVKGISEDGEKSTTFDLTIEE